jgi:virginiamycin A acetyltransferase
MNYFSEWHPHDNTSSVLSKGKITIGSDVWIATDVIILSGVTIGDGCCIGARSVVTKSLKPYTICVGVPCKEVKNRYPDDIIKILLDIKWWNWDDEKIKINKKFFFTNLNKITADELLKIIV